MGQTTFKTIGLSYRPVRGTGMYSHLDGVLKGMTVVQDEHDSTTIDGEFFESPFDAIYRGKPVVFEFELANYTFEELSDIFGGEYNTQEETYDSNGDVYTTEREWRLNFGKGNLSVVIYRGLTVGTIKKDTDGALNFSVKITSRNFVDANGEHIYKIVGRYSKEGYPMVENNVLMFYPLAESPRVEDNVLVFDDDPLVFAEYNKLFLLKNY